jgi:hypothetical protein
MQKKYNTHNDKTNNYNILHPSFHRKHNQGMTEKEFGKLHHRLWTGHDQVCGEEYKSTVAKTTQNMGTLNVDYGTFGWQNMF